MSIQLTFLRFFIVRSRQTPKRIRDREPKSRAMRAAVSMKKPSGTMLMSMSVAGSRIHRSLLKKIWWNMMKYLVDVYKRQAGYG